MGAGNMVGTQDRMFDWITLVLLGFVGLVCVLPLLYVFSTSLTPYSEFLKSGGFVLIPTHLTILAYKELFEYGGVLQAFGVTVTITVVGTVLNMFLTTLMAYALSKKDLPGRRIILLLIVFTLLFNPGIIPLYMTVKMTGLLNSIWAMIIPNAVWSFNILVMKSFFEALPEDLFEAARIDGAGEFAVLWRVTIPLSIPVMLTIGLFYAVGHWNEYFQAIMYVTNPNLYPLQVVIDNILNQSQNALDSVDTLVPTVSMQMAAVVTASLPIIAVYPFIQKHFTKGMMLGAIKG